MILSESKINPLKIILEIIPREETSVTIGMMTRLNLALISGGVKCEDPNEILACLNVLAEMGLIEVKQEDNFTKVRNIHNGD